MAELKNVPLMKSLVQKVSEPDYLVSDAFVQMFSTAKVFYY